MESQRAERLQGRDAPGVACGGESQLAAASGPGCGDLLTLAVRTAELGIFDHDHLSGLLTWSPEMRALCGFAADWPPSIPGFLERVHPADRAGVAAAILASHAPDGDGGYGIENRLVMPDGRIRWVKQTGQTYFDGQGAARHPVRTVGVMTDITTRKEAEAATRESERALATLVANLPGAAYRCRNDEHWTEEFISARCRDITGYAPEDFTSGRMTWARMMYPADEPPIRAAVQAALARRQAWQLEYRIRHATGVDRWVWEQGRGVFDEAGQLLHLEGFLTDVSNQHDAATALRESDSQVRRQLAEIEAIYATAPVGLCVLDRDLRFVRINQRLAEINGLAPAEHLGKTVREIVPALADAVEPLFRQIFMTGQPILNFELSGETKAQPSVRRHWMEHWLPLRDAAGHVTALSIVVEEVTARKRAEEQIHRLNVELEQRVAERTGALQLANEGLRESETKFRAYVEQSPNLILITCQGRVVYANPACPRLLGYRPARFQTANLKFSELFAPESAAVVQAGIEALRRDVHSDLRSEVTLLTQRGRRVDAILATRLIQHDYQPAVLCIMTDITARKRAERQGREQQRRLRQLAEKLATAQDAEQRRIAEGLHDDVAQILAACSVKLAVMRDEANRRKARALHAQIEALLRQADAKIHLLSFELGSSTLRRLGLSEALRELSENFADRYGVRFEVLNVGNVQLRDTTTATILFKAARELMFNVVKHAGVKSASITLRQSKDRVRLVVEDHGRGFHAASGPDEAAASGGLGLFGIRERLRDLGGRLQVQSVRGVRTGVTVSVPRLKGE